MTNRFMKETSRPYPTVTLFGLPFSKMNMRETVDYLAGAIERREPTQVITGNPIMIMAGLDDPDYYRVMAEAELIVPDGAGVVWAAERAGDPVQERVAGFDLLHELMREGERRRWSVYLLGTTQETIEEAARRLQESYPLVRLPVAATAISGRMRTRPSSRGFARPRRICSLWPGRLRPRSRGSAGTSKSSAFP